MKGRALRRALQTQDVLRITEDIPVLTDATELITPERAYELLEHNVANRVINWRRVEDYAEIMRQGRWRVHGQGIMLDTDGNLLTGQHRLWAVIYADRAVTMRVSRGNPPDVATLIDRGAPQSSRDLASRQTHRKHSPVETSLARGVLAFQGTVKPSPEQVSAQIVAQAPVASALLAMTARTKKPKAVMMVLAALCVHHTEAATVTDAVLQLDEMTRQLTMCLAPNTAEQCWGRGAAFVLAMREAVKITLHTKETS